MMRTLLRVGWLGLKRDRIALALTFAFPIIFFSIFSFIFGGMGGSSGGGAEGVRIAVADLDGSDASRRITAALREEPALRVMPGSQTPDEARVLVRGGKVPVALVLPEGFGAGLDGSAPQAPAEILFDEADPVARQMVAGLLQKTVTTAVPELFFKRGMEMLKQYGGPLTEQQKRAVEMAPSVLGEGDGESLSPVAMRMTNVRAAEDGDDGGPTGSMVAYYAAGIGVMFLLFSMAGAAGTLLEEEENGTLERMLAGSVPMRTFLLGRWLFFALVGTAQIALMFLWGALVFGLDLFEPNRIAGVVVMTVATAAAASAFGMLLATLSRTRAQLGGMSTIVILIMSALGGSMVPRFVMPDFMNTTALFTFNGWALDGYLKVFWYDDPGASLASSVVNLLPQLAALTVMTVVFLVLGRFLARRWESA